MLFCRFSLSVYVFQYPSLKKLSHSWHHHKRVIALHKLPMLSYHGQGISLFMPTLYTNNIDFIERTQKMYMNTDVLLF